MAAQNQHISPTRYELNGRAPAHHAVATRRGLRETKRRLDAKLERLMWVTIGGLGAVVIALIGMIAALVALIVQM